MPNPGSIIGQFTDEISELGKQVVQEVAKVPKDVAGKALESLGASSGKTSQAKVNSGNPKDSRNLEDDPLQKMNQAKNRKTKESIARAALEQIAGIYKKKQKEPSAWEKIQMEAEQKKQISVQQQVQASASQLPQTASKRPRGDLYGAKAKQTSAERKATRQD